MIVFFVLLWYNSENFQIGKKTMKKKSKNSLIYRWTNDKNPVGVSGKPSKIKRSEKKIEIKYVADINEVLNENKEK